MSDMMASSPPQGMQPGMQGGMQGGMPPELASLLGGAGADDAAPQGGAPQDSEGYVQAILDMIDEWRQAEEDPQDLLVLEKISTLLQGISTGRAKESMDAMQGKMSPRMLAQSYGG